MNHSHLLELRDGTERRSPDLNPAVEGDANWRLLCCDLHDGAAQYVAAALQRLQVIEVQDGISTEAKPHLHVARSLLDVALRDIRDIISGRSPARSLQAGLVPALKRLVQEMVSDSNVEIELVESLDRRRLTPPLETAVYWIVQESINNSIRHSATTHIRVEIASRREVLRLEIRDWGAGFDPSTINRERRGLRGIRERAESLSGTTSIEAEPGWGTLVAVELPLPPP